MKAMRFTLVLGVFAILASVLPVNAATLVSPEATREAIVKKALDNKASLALDAKMEKKMAKLTHKFQKRIAKFERFFGKSEPGGVDFKDPVQKWLWFGLLAWLAGALLYSFGWFIAAPFLYLGYLCWLAGTACIVIWLLKKTGNM